MERKNFIQHSLLAGAAGLTGQSLFANSERRRIQDSDKSSFIKIPEDRPFNLNYAFHDGMFRNHGGADFIDQIKFAHDKGFRSIEDNGMMSRTPEMQQKIGDTLAKLGMKMGVFVITSDSWHWKTSLATGKKEFIERMQKDCRTAIDVAKRCNAKWMTVVPGNFDRSQSFEMQTANVIDALRLGAEILEPHRLVMVLEPLSDNPDLFLRYSHQTFMICKAVKSASCKILFDIYHMQRNEGNLISNIDKCWDEIAYIQIGDNPGRKEPTTGEINYKNIFKHLHSKGYKDILGMEHGNATEGKDGELALIKAYREVDAFM
jgi:hydroxypyruvate isomerase